MPIGPLSIIRETLRRVGPKGLWTGVGLTAARDGAGCTVFFLAAGAVMSPPGEGGTSSAVALAAGGAVGGIGFWVAALPFDTVKTVVQREGGKMSARDVVTSMYRECGGNVSAVMRKLISGWQVAFIKGAPAAAFTVLTYELVKRELEEKVFVTDNVEI